MKGKIIGIFLFICLAAPIASTFTFLHYQKLKIRKEVKRQIIAGIDKEELVLLSFTEKESETLLRWKHSKEFEYNGKMYDIVEAENNGDTTDYWCWLDDHETKLYKQLDELLASVLGKDKKNKDRKSKLARFFKSLFSSEPQAWNICSLQSIQIFHHYSYTCNMVFYSPPNPPPEVS